MDIQGFANNMIERLVCQQRLRNLRWQKDYLELTIECLRKMLEEVDAEIMKVGGPYDHK